MRLTLIFLFAACFFRGLANKNTLPLNTPVDTAKKHKKEVIFPDPVGVSKLFYIQRDPNANTLVYELNEKAGELDSKEPVHAYWIRYAEKGQKEELSYIQRKFAYGMNFTKLKNNDYDVRFAAYKKLLLTLQKGTDGKYHIFTKIDKKEAVLNRIFVKIEGGSFWIPNIVYAELTGIDVATGKEMIERFKP